MQKILTVADRFDIRGRGLIVVPGPLLADFERPCSFEVELRRPDGSMVTAALELQHMFITPPPVEHRYGAILRGLGKDDVPIGTEIWRILE